MGPVFIGLVYATIPIGITVLMVLKYREVRRARLWSSTDGKVLVSTVVARRRSPGDPAYNNTHTEISHEPRVEYEYHVAGKTYRGHKVDLGEKTSSYDLEKILDRYPVGAAVTVYYDAADPTRAVLDREFPWWVWAGGAGCVVAAVAFPLVAAAVYFLGVDWLKARLPDPKTAPFVMAATGFGAVALLMGLGFFLYILRAYRWPVTRGRIVASGVEGYYDKRSDEGRYSYRNAYKSGVVYEYEVNGRTYRGDRVTLGLTVSSTLPGVARMTARRYPVGTEVRVRYDPRTPSDSVLRPFSVLHLIIPLAAGAVLWLAWVAAMGGR